MKLNLFSKTMAGLKLKTLGWKSWKTVYPSAFFSSSSSFKATKVINEEGVRTVTLCNPKSRNALSLSTLNEIINHITLNKEDCDVRCIVIQAEGPVFSSGHNLKEFDISKTGSSHHREVFAACSQLMMGVVQCAVPVVAVVDGLAAAAGCQLVAQCDLALCTPSSTFSTPGANFGLFCSTPGIAVARSVSRKIALRMLLTGLPITADEAYICGLVSKIVPEERLTNFGLFCSTPGIAVARSVSRKIALRMLLTGLPITADEAYICGLVSKIVPEERLTNFGLFCSTPGIAVARSVSRKIALRMLLTGLPITADEAYICGLVSKIVPEERLKHELKIITDAIQIKSRSVISLGKTFFYQQIENDLQTAYRLGEEVMVNNLTLKDGQEGIKSFVEKRKPTWNHSFQN